MPVSYRFEGTTLRFVNEGQYSLEEFLTKLNAALGESSRPQPCPLMIDLRTSTESRTQEEILKLADALGACQPALGTRCAAVVARTHHYGLGRMLSAHLALRGIDYGVFHEMDEAEAWLGAAPDAP